MSETSQHKLYWLPNALTVSRILLIPVLVWAIAYSYLGWVAFLIFVFCMLTDFLDGKLSRAWGVTSDFGRMLDPIADKLLVAASLIAFCILLGGMAMILVPALIIIGRDITVSGVREYAALSRKVMPPTKLAKWKTFAEMAGILLLITSLIMSDGLFADMFQAYESGKGMSIVSLKFSTIGILRQTGIIILWLAAILSAYTGFRYFRAALVKTEVIDGPLDVKPFTDLMDDES